MGSTLPDGLKLITPSVCREEEDRRRGGGFLAIYSFKCRHNWTSQGEESKARALYVLMSLQIQNTFYLPKFPPQMSKISSDIGANYYNIYSPFSPYGQQAGTDDQFIIMDFTC